MINPCTKKLVSVCVCTYRRPQLSDCLDSIARLRIPENFAVNIVVVDNSPELAAAGTVEHFRKTHDIELEYRSCPLRNLSSVRNEALNAADGDYIALVDDDEIVTKHWLRHLLECSTRYDADVVIGPVINRYSETCPPWLAKADLMARLNPSTGQKLITGHSGNALIRRKRLPEHTLAFDEYLGKTGGEDTNFFFQLHRRGAKIIGCAEAIAVEVIEPKRENMAYLLAENKRIGQVFSRVFWPSLSMSERLIALVQILSKVMIFGAGFVLTYAFGRRFSTYWRLHCACNVEKIRYLCKKDQTVVPYCL